MNIFLCLQELLNQKTTISTTNKAPTVTTATPSPRFNRIPVKTIPSLTLITDNDDASQNDQQENVGAKIRREELELMQ